MKKQSLLKIGSALMAMLIVLTSIGLSAVVVAADDANAGYDLWAGLTKDADGTITAGADTSWFDANSDVREYEIDTAAKLAGLAKLTNDAGVKEPGYFEGYTFYITKNLDLGGHEWTPIGDANARAFAGTLVGKLNGVEGASVTIKNMTISDGQNVGLVGTQGAGGIKNITLVNAKITTSKNTAGSFVGYAKLTATSYENLVSDASIRSTATSYVGGIVAYANTSAAITFKNCVYTGSINASSLTYCGGIAGSSLKDTTIENCYVSSNMQVGKYSGGFLGLANSNATLKNCQFDGTAYSTATQVGSFIGRINTSAAGITINFENCLNTGLSKNNRADNLASGFSWIGLAANSASAEPAYIATLNFTNCYGTSHIGFASRNDANENFPTVYTVNVNGTTAVVNGSTVASMISYKPTVLTPAQLAGDAAKTNLTGYDFETVWATRAGMNPVLAIAKDIAPTTYATADLSWFNPEKEADAETGRISFKIETEAQLLGLSLFNKACYDATVFDFVVVPALKSKLTSALFTNAYLDAIMVEGEESGGDEVVIDPDKIDKTPSIWDGVSFDTSWYNPDVPETSYVIDSAAKLAGLASICNETNNYNGHFVGVTFYITCNIDLNNKEWPVIGHSNQHAFGGLLVGKLGGLEGNQVTIQNMSITNPFEANLGLVGTQSAGGIKNITLQNAVITTTKNTAGSFVGYSRTNSAVYENLYSDAKITTSAAKWAGGIVAYSNAPDTTFRNCVFTGSITVDEIAYDNWLVGGITGNVKQNTLMENCYVSATIVTPGTRCGGLIGDVDAPGKTITIKNCQFDGIVASSNKSAGAMIGTINAEASTTPVVVKFENVLNTGVSKNSYEPITASFSWIGQVKDETPAAQDTPANTATILFTNCFDRKATKLLAFNDMSAENPAQFTVTVNGTTQVYSATANQVMADLTVTALEPVKLAGDAAKTNLTGYDFENVWATRDGMTPVLAIAKEVAPTTYATADLTWFDPEGDTFAIENEAQLLGYAMLSYIIDVEDYTFTVADSLKAKMTAELFSEAYLTALNGGNQGGNQGGSQGGEDDTTNEEVTTDDEEVTTNKGEVTTKAPDKGDDNKDDSGCASTVSGACLMGIIALAAGAIAIRKKKED